MTEPMEIDEATAAFISRNIELAFAMTRELLDNPALIEQVPDKATVFVAPPDAPDYARRQMERARTFAGNGYRSVVWRLGADDDEPRAIPVAVSPEGAPKEAGADAA